MLAAHVVEEPEPIDKLRPGMPAILATLVINRNRAVAVDTLISAVWGESPLPGARGSADVLSDRGRALGRHRVASVPCA